MANLALNPDRLGDAGRQLFGEHWQSPLANALGIDTRLLRYWLNGQHRPSPAQLRTLVALLQYSATYNQNLANYFQATLGRAERRDREPTFDASELRRIDRHTVEHIPTGSRATFYEYAAPPPNDYIPGATITNAAAWGENDLVRFNIAAWKLLSDYRYRPYMAHVRHILRTMRKGSMAEEIITAVQRDFPSIEGHRVLACLREMAEAGEISFSSVGGLVRSADPKPSAL